MARQPKEKSMNKKVIMKPGRTSYNATCIGIVFNVIGLSCLLTIGCTQVGSNGEIEIETVHNACAVAPADACGFDIETKLIRPYRLEFKHHKDSKHHDDYDGFRGLIKLRNTTRSKASSFTLFLDIADAKIVQMIGYDYTETEGGYLVSLEGRHFEKRKQNFSIVFDAIGEYQYIDAYMISVNDQSCDTVAPSVTLNASETLLPTTGGVVTLTAETDDNVAVKKVVFAKDGAVIGEDFEAPYELDVELTDAGKHVFTATAIDLTGNEGSDTQIVRVRFFGTGAGGAADFEAMPSFFNQITPENAAKWGSVESVRDEMNWTILDETYQFALENNMPFKLHTLVWGSQQPEWLGELTEEEQLAEIEEWMAALAERYPDVDMIDVVNEPLHSTPVYKDALGGDGETGFDWVIRAFEMARAYFPNAELLLNDYNIVILEQFTAPYLEVITLLQERGLIDAIGVQGHFLERANIDVVATNLATLATTGLPLYVTELDISFADDARHAERMRDLVTVFFDNPAVCGITHWAFREGETWLPDAHLLNADGTPRPAHEWLECYLGGGEDCPVPEYIPEPRVGEESGIVLQAEDYDTAEGLVALGNAIGYHSDGDWMRFDRVTFNINWDILSVTYIKGNEEPGSMAVYLDTMDDAPMIIVDLPPTGGGNATVSVPIAPIEGDHDVIFAFIGTFAGANVDKIAFSAPKGRDVNVIPNGHFEVDASGWYSWGGYTISTSEYAYSGAQSLLISDRSGNSPAAVTLTNDVEAGKTYLTSFWVTIDGAESANVNVTTKIQCVGQDATYAWLGQTTVAQGVWEEIAGDVTIPDCDIAEVTLYAEGPEAGIDLYVDHVSMRAPAPITQENIVPNGTFESGTDGWFSWNGGVITTSTFAHGGAQSLMVTDRSSANPPAATDLTAAVTPGVTYNASMWVSIANAASASVNATTMIKCTGQDASFSWLAQVTASENTWTEISGTIAIPDCDIETFMLYAEGPGEGIDLLLDDVEVLAPPAEEDENLIPDGDFESGIGEWFGWNNTSLVVTDTHAHGGTQSLVSMNRTANGAIARNIASIVTPGSSYAVTFWVSVGNVDAAQNVNVTEAIQCDGESANYTWLGQVSVADSEWVEITGTIDLPDCVLTQVTLYAEGTSTGDLYVDDVTVYLL